jgi:hypothetical protein
VLAQSDEASVLTTHQAIIKRDAARLQEQLISSGGYAAYLKRLEAVLQAEFLQTTRPASRLSLDSEFESTTTANTSCKMETTTTQIQVHSRTPPPISQLNTFLLYRLCIGVLGSISDSTHPPKAQGTLCRCVCERTLASAETWLGKNKLAKTTEKRTLFPERETAMICKKELLKVFGGLEWEEVVWKT